MGIDMQDQNAEASPEVNVENNDVDISSAENAVIDSPAPSTEQTGELPDDFKGRLAREKKRHERAEAQLRAEVAQMQQTMQAVLNASSVSAPAPVGEVASPENDIQKAVQSEITRLMQKANADKLAKEMSVRVAKVYQEMDKAAEDIYPDFDEVRNDRTLNFPPELLQNIAISCKNPVDVIYHLAKNDRETLGQIAYQPPALQVGEIARISAELMVKGTGKAKEVTKAPAPANSLTTNPAANSGRIKESASVDELRKLFR